jgi:glycosyltransferase involved in cell wall biosynthesis
MVMPSYYPVVGGMEIQIERQVPFLREQGIDVAVLTRRTTGTTKAEERDGVEIRRVSIPGGPGLRSISFTALGSLDILRHRKSIDLIHAHSIMSPATIAALACRPARSASLVTIHNSYEIPHLFGKPLGRQRLHWFRRLMSRFVSISSEIHGLLVENGVPPTSIVSIPNGIDTSQFRPAFGAERAALREAQVLPQDEPIVVFAGRLQPVKQVDILLDAWAGIDDGRLVILGDGQERLSLMAQAQRLGLAGRVEFRGMVPNVADYLRAADIFILPSSSEGLSVALLEAMSSGMLPIATSVGGTVDVIEDGVSGLLVTSGDIAGLRDALSRALCNPDWRRDASSKARATAVDSYDLRVIAERLATVYRDVVGSRRR